jgi:hypothetical protein
MANCRRVNARKVSQFKPLKPLPRRPFEPRAVPAPSTTWNRVQLHDFVYHFLVIVCTFLSLAALPGDCENLFVRESAMNALRAQHQPIRRQK